MTIFTQKEFEEWVEYLIRKEYIFKWHEYEYLPRFLSLLGVIKDED